MVAQKDVGLAGYSAEKKAVWMVVQKVSMRADYWAVLKAERTAVQKGKPTVGK